MRRIFLGITIFAVLMMFRLWMVNNIGFTNSEHTLVYRSWSLSRFGLDEFGRRTPLLFGSNEGVQLPLVSYLSSPITFVLGSNVFSETILDFFFLLLPFFAAWFLGYGIGTAALLTLNPIFFWPGLWEAKLFTALLLVLYKAVTSKNINIVVTVTAGILAVMTSFDAWFFVPGILLIGLYKKIKSKDGKIILLGSITIVFALVLVLASIMNKDISSHLKAKYINFNQDVSILNSINSFRGEDLKFGFASSGRFLHNKLQYIPVIIGQSISYLNPSYLFATGDKNPMSNSMWVPPLLSIYFFLLLFSIFLPQPKASTTLYFWILSGSLFLGLMRFPQTEQSIYLIAIPISLIISNKVKGYSNAIILTIYLVAIGNLFFLGTISGTVSSLYKISCPLELAKSIVSTVRDTSYGQISVTDDVCSDLGPGIAMLMSKKPVETKTGFVQKSIRTIQNIKIISPEVISLEDLSKTYVYILSKKLSDNVPDYLPINRFVNKQRVYAGSSENYSMYLLSADVKK